MPQVLFEKSSNCYHFVMKQANYFSKKSIQEQEATSTLRQLVLRN